MTTGPWQIPAPGEYNPRQDYPIHSFEEAKQAFLSEREVSLLAPSVIESRTPCGTKQKIVHDVYLNNTVNSPAVEMFNSAQNSWADIGAERHLEFAAERMSQWNTALQQQRLRDVHSGKASETADKSLHFMQVTPFTISRIMGDEDCQKHLQTLASDSDGTLPLSVQGHTPWRPDIGASRIPGPLEYNMTESLATAQSRMKEVPKHCAVSHVLQTHVDETGSTWVGPGLAILANDPQDSALTKAIIDWPYSPFGIQKTRGTTDLYFETRLAETKAADASQYGGRRWTATHFPHLGTLAKESITEGHQGYVAFFLLNPLYA